MPTGTLIYHPDYELEAMVLAQALPGLAAQHLNVEGAPVHEGGVTVDEVIVLLQKGGKQDINAPDLIVHFRAHNFPERVLDCQQRTEYLHDAFRNYLDRNGFSALSLSAELELANLGYKASYSGEKIE